MIRTRWVSLTLLGSILIVHSAFVACAGSRARSHAAASLDQKINVDGLDRFYHLYIPATYNDSGAIPLAVALHGGGDHTWPGGHQYLPELLIGKTNMDLKATETIWNFFNGYPQ